MIKTISGRTLDERDLAFNARTYHFSLISTGEDVTNDIYRRDKLALVPDFDERQENYRLSVEKPASGGGRTGTESDLQDLNTNSGSIFVDQVTSDPLAAPLETVDKAVKQVLASSGIRTVLILAALGIAAAIYLKK